MSGVDNNGLLVLTGMHRSGTTFSGRILSSLKGVVYLHEPFNYRYGCKGVPCVYPCAGPHGEGLTPEFKDTIDDIINLRCRYRVRAEDDSPVKAVLRRVSGGRGGIDLMKARLAQTFGPKRHRLMLKDPFAFMLTPYLANTYRAKVVVMVRHPVAVWQSIKRMGWTMSFENFGGAGFWESPEGREHCIEMLESASEPEKVAYLWRFLYSLLPRWTREYPDKIMIVRHEDLCTEPVREMEKVIKHFGLEADDAFIARLEEFTSGDKVSARTDRLHDFKRDSKALAYSWTEKVDAVEEESIRKITEEPYFGIYERWRPDEQPAGSR